MMPTTERRYAVRLYGDRIGTLNQRGDFTWFRFTDDYLRNPNRSVLGLAFEDDLNASHASNLRLAPWFSNLLPEGRLRDWIASAREVSVDREMELLAQVGHDLPGAVEVLPEAEPPDRDSLAEDTILSTESVAGEQPIGWRFSLAGVALKFSMLRDGDRLTLPAWGEGGDWIVKLPDATYRNVPLNEFAMMSLARAAGLDVPDTLLIERNLVEGLPEDVWSSDEGLAYAVRRFDRPAGGGKIHIEDFAQVRSIMPYGMGKYSGNLETVAALVYRRSDMPALLEFARRLTFNVLISNGDAHLKNWSLIYRNPRIPTLSPVYDLVSTAVYSIGGSEENLGLRFNGSRRFELVRLDGFRRLARILDVPADALLDCVAETVERVVREWPSIGAMLSADPELQESVGRSIQIRSQSLMR